MGVQRYLIGILIFMMTNDTEHLFMHLLTNYTSFLVWYQVFAHFVIGLFMFLLMSCSCFFYIPTTIYLMSDVYFRYFIPEYGLPLHF